MYYEPVVDKPKALHLTPVLEKFSPPSEVFHLYYPACTMMPGKLRAFLDFIREVNRHQ